MKIALIDDDVIFKKLTKIRLRRYDLSKDILTFRDGEEAISYLKEHAKQVEALPDIILLDINMPKMNGWDFLKKFRKIKFDLRKTIKLYMVSSSFNPDDMDKANEYQDLLGYFVKPISESDYKEIAESIQ
jgi:two-component system, chemotaxis family, chemotaxis protein CheY